MLILQGNKGEKGEEVVGLDGPEGEQGEKVSVCTYVRTVMLCCCNDKFMIVIFLWTYRVKRAMLECKVSRLELYFPCE